MSDYSQIASDSMKKLTEKVIRADLASRKRQIIFHRAYGFVRLLWIPVFLYSCNALYNPYGLFMRVNREAGDPANMWKLVFGENKVPMRQLFRPEIYHRDQGLKLRRYAEVTQNEVAKDEKLTFKPYIWN